MQEQTSASLVLQKSAGGAVREGQREDFAGVQSCTGLYGWAALAVNTEQHEVVMCRWDPGQSLQCRLRRRAVGYRCIYSYGQNLAESG